MNKKEIDEMEVESLKHHGGFQKYKNLLTGFDDEAKQEARELEKEYGFAIHIPYKEKFRALCAVHCFDIMEAHINYPPNGGAWVSAYHALYVSKKAFIAFEKFAKKYAAKIAKGEYDLYEKSI